MNQRLLITRRMADRPDDSNTLDAYHATGGYVQARRAVGMTRDDLVETVKASGLLGRGGAAFSGAVSGYDRPGFPAVRCRKRPALRRTTRRR